MAKLVVEVLDASDLMPKDGQGSSSPYVEVDFNQQRHRTQTKNRDLNPVWNEKLVFHVQNPREVSDSTIDVVMYNDSKGGIHKTFLGRVRISGVSIVDETQASVVRYPLEKRGLFSHIRGDIGLKIFVINDTYYAGGEGRGGGNPVELPPPAEEIQIEKMSRKKKKKEVRTFHSIGNNTGRMPPPPSVSVPPAGGTGIPGFGFDNSKPGNRTDAMRVGQTVPMQHMQYPGKPEYGLEETRPPLAARMGYKGGYYKPASTFDLVEQMHYLYVNVVKAKDLPSMDLTGSLDPYVEVKLGNYKGITRHFDKNQNPVWMQIFAFSKENLQSNFCEVVVKDKDTITKDDFVGRVYFDITEVPHRVPPDSPLAPQWYRLEDTKGEKTQGEVMLAVWMGTQADESFSDAWHSDAHDIKHDDLSSTRSKVYFSPRLFYLRLHVIEAQDLVPSDRGRPLNILVKIQLGNQLRTTQPSSLRSVNPIWNEELMFVVPEPMDEFIIITVEDRVGHNKDEILGRVILPVSVARPRFENKMVDTQWFNLESPSSSASEAEAAAKKEVKFASKIHLRLCIDAGYHVLDEATHYSSDLQPSAKQLQKPTIGILELGILSAKNLLPMKTMNGRATDPYCVAKYGNKWVRTRTLLNTLVPRWNEQYTWEVYDPCTVITVGVFDNCHIHNHNDESGRDQRIGKVRIRLSTLETDRVYTHYYPLLSLHPSGLKKMGELHLALRFTCTAWVNMVTLYGLPLLPKMHYIQPISVRHIDWLRHQAMQLVAARLARSEPPLRRETVEYMLDVDYHMWSLRRSKANFNRIMSLLSGIVVIGKWFDDICHWKNPMTTSLVHVLFVILVCYPELILPTIFLYLFVIGLWNYRFRPRNPPHMDPRLSYADRVHPDELDEEFDTFPTSRPSDIVRMRYDRLRSVAGRVQVVAGDLATQGERVQGLLSWRDPKATAIFIVFSLFWAMFLYVTPIQVVAVLVGLYWLRHPRFRNKLPSVPFNFFKRLPAKSDMLI